MSEIDPFGQLARRKVVRDALDRLQQPSDDNVWRARIVGGLAGAGRAAYDMLAGEDEDLMDPTIGVSPVASIGQKGVKEAAELAYKHIKGMPGLYSKLTDAATKLPDVVNSKKALEMLRSLGATAEEMDVRGISRQLG